MKSMIENIAFEEVFGLTRPGQRMIAAVRIAASVTLPSSPRNGPELPMAGVSWLPISPGDLAIWPVVRGESDERILCPMIVSMAPMDGPAALPLSTVVCWWRGNQEQGVHPWPAQATRRNRHRNQGERDCPQKRQCGPGIESYAERDLMAPFIAILRKFTSGCDLAWDIIGRVGGLPCSGKASKE